jgi:hypothetical protein
MRRTIFTWRAISLPPFTISWQDCSAGHAGQLLHRVPRLHQFPHIRCGLRFVEFTFVKAVLCAAFEE